jgi:MFS family permease
MIDSQQPTLIRYRIIVVCMLMAFILYLDRICMGEIVKSISFNHDLQLSKEQIGRILGAFFFSYALLQVPAGWTSDRFGARATLTIYITLWSLVTVATGLMTGFVGLLVARLLCGVSEAGAYPTSMAVVRKWMPFTSRARASGMIALGGRVGGTLAPFLTIWMIVHMGSWRNSLWLDGGVGLVVAWIFWTVVRSNPQEHPQVNAAELALIGRPHMEKPLSGRELKSALGSFIRSRLGLPRNLVADLPGGAARRGRSGRRSPGDLRAGLRDVGPNCGWLLLRLDDATVWSALGAGHSHVELHVPLCGGLHLLSVFGNHLGPYRVLRHRVNGHGHGQSSDMGFHERRGRPRHRRRRRLGKHVG